MLVLCKNCGAEFDKKPNQIRKTNNNFCSKSCAAIYNNKKYPKRKSSRSMICPGCTGRKDYVARECHSCRISRIFNENMKKPICKFFINGASKVKYASVRQLGHKHLRLNNIPKVCHICEFDAVVEACHIKPISSFPETALLSEVNALTNLKYLCPNHHAMLDKKLLEL